MQLDERKRKIIKQWLELAEEDFRVAEFTFKMESSIPYRVIAFHAQQAAEKYLKALLVLNNVDFPYTHDLFKLIELIPESLNLKNELKSVIKLTEYAVNRRYPDFYENLTLKEAKEAVSLASFTKDKLKRYFTEAGYKLQ